MKTSYLLFIGMPLVVISLAIAYYFVIFMPGKQLAELNIKQQQVDLEKKQYEEKSAAEKIENSKQQTNRKYYEMCDTEASNAARDLLKKKSELPGGNQFNAAAEKGLFLKDDYSTYYERCIRKYGLN